MEWARGEMPGPKPVARSDSAVRMRARSDVLVSLSTVYVHDDLIHVTYHYTGYTESVKKRI